MQQDAVETKLGAVGTFLDSLKKSVILPCYRPGERRDRLEEAMQEAGQSAVSRFLRFFSIAPLPGDEDAGDDDVRDLDQDRSQAAAEIERKLAQRDESFFWTWHYPGQW